MNKLVEYPKLIKRRLTRYIELCDHRKNPDMETFLIADDARGHYIWMNVEWPEGDRLMGITVYVRLRDGKFWIEEDWTEEGMANDLVREGVPKEDIVLAFHNPIAFYSVGWVEV